LDCQFVEGDIYQTAPEFDSAFDLVVITIGVLGWMPELGKFFDVAVRLLRPGGQLFIHEQHPITNMLEPGDDAQSVAFFSSPTLEPGVEIGSLVDDEAMAEWPQEARPALGSPELLKGAMRYCAVFSRGPRPKVLMWSFHLGHFPPGDACNRRLIGSKRIRFERILLHNGRS
jgi:SAM-dependent methyltransferase